MYLQVRDSPRLAPANYREIYDKPCELVGEFNWLKQVYRGTGVAPKDHPAENVPIGNCENCKSENVLAIYTQWSVSPHSGDKYWDYEIFCEDCGKYTSKSYAEND
ncbi:MAG: hypothetical protein ACTSXA_06765 [Candidatus Heimdallarchaeota archaeon]